MAYWSGGYPNKLKDHLANNCKQVPELVNLFYLGIVFSRNFGNKLSHKKRKIQDYSNQYKLTDWFESTNLPFSKIAFITHALVHAFICCEIPFSVIKNSFFIEFLHKIRLEYKSSIDELLSGRLLNEEIVRINENINSVKNSKNLTFSKSFDKFRILFLIHF
jgi:hypothetical protein